MSSVTCISVTYTGPPIEGGHLGSARPEGWGRLEEICDKDAETTGVIWSPSLTWKEAVVPSPRTGLSPQLAQTLAVLTWGKRTAGARPDTHHSSPGEF